MPFFRHPRIPSFFDEEDARRTRTTEKTHGRMANAPTNPFSGNLTRQAQAEKALAARDRDRENLALLRDSDPVDIKYALELDGPEDRLARLGIGAPRRTSQAPQTPQTTLTSQAPHTPQPAPHVRNYTREARIASAAFERAEARGVDLNALVADPVRERSLWDRLIDVFTAPGPHQTDLRQWGRPNNGNWYGDWARQWERRGDRDRPIANADGGLFGQGRGVGPLLAPSDAGSATAPTVGSGNLTQAAAADSKRAAARQYLEDRALVNAWRKPTVGSALNAPGAPRNLTREAALESAQARLDEIGDLSDWRAPRAASPAETTNLTLQAKAERAAERRAKTLEGLQLLASDRAQAVAQAGGQDGDRSGVQVAEAQGAAGQPFPAPTLPQGSQTHFPRPPQPPRPVAPDEMVFPRAPQPSQPPFSVEWQGFTYVGDGARYLPGVAEVNPDFDPAGDDLRLNQAAYDAVTSVEKFAPDFLDRIHEKESQRLGYRAVATQALSNGYRALGRYQLTPDALVDAGLMQIVEPNPRAQHPDYANTPENKIPRTYRWVGAVDIGSETLQINSAQDFLESPEAQEYAMAAYLNEQKKTINTLKLHHYIGKTIQGVEGEIKITMEGLVAASHRRGVGKLKEYLQALGQGSDTSFDYNSASAYRDVN